MTLGKSFIVLAGLLMCASVGLAQSEPGKQGKPEKVCREEPAKSSDFSQRDFPGSWKLERRIYCVSHLVIPAVSYHANDEPILHQANEKPAAPASQTDSSEKLIALILYKVAPSTWNRAGGQGMIDCLLNDRTLIVNQTPKVHAELQAFLKKIERGQVSVDMRIVLVQPRIAEGIRWTTKNDTSFTSFDQDSLKKVIQYWTGDARTRILHSPKLTMLDGVCACLSLSQVMTMTTGVTTQEIGGQKQVVPRNENFKDGIWTDIRAVASEDRSRVKLDIDFTLRQLSRTESSVIRVPIRVGDENSGKSGKAEQEGVLNLKIQKPVFHDVKVAVTASIPNGRTLAIRAGHQIVERRVEDSSVWSELPIVGGFFRNVQYERELAEVLVLFTPQILVNGDDEVDVEPLRTRIESVDDGKFPLIAPDSGK